MRRLRAAFIIAILAIICLAAPVGAEPRYVPHEDPEAAVDYIDAPALLSYYTDILIRIDQGDYAGAIDLIDKLKYAHIPEEHRTLLEQYGGLMSNLPDTISSGRGLLDMASSLIAQYRLSEAGEQLDQAQSLLDNMDALLQDIEQDTESVGDVLGVFESLPSSFLRLAYDALENSVGLIRELKEEMEQLRARLDTAIADLLAKDLKETQITLSLSPRSAYVGDTINVSGTLSCNESYLPDRNVLITIDGAITKTIVTDKNGDFAGSITVPFKYVSSMTFRALYTPSGKGLDDYLPSLSAPAALAVDYYVTDMNISMPQQAFLGMTFDIGGQVSWENAGSLNSRVLHIFMDDDLLSTMNVSPGTFEIPVSITADTTLGAHTIETLISPDGRYAGVSAATSFTVVRTPPQVTLNVTDRIVAPSKIRISGTVSSPLPIEGAAVRVQFLGRTAETQIDERGHFSVELSIGLEWGLLGNRDMVVTIFPVEPWNAATEVKASIFVLSAANISLTALLALAIVVFLFITLHRRRRKRITQGPRGIPSRPDVETGHGKSEPVKAKAEIGGNKGRVLKSYALAVQAGQRKGLGVMEPHMTMREFLAAVAPALGTAGEGFARLTSLAERALYSSHEIEDAEAVEAEGISSQMAEVSRGGNA